jgi:hypothetical protein
MKNNSSAAVSSGNVMGPARGGSGDTEEGLKEVRMHGIDAFEQGAARGGEEERAVEEIRSRIRGWSVSERNEIGIGVVSEVYFAETPEGNSVGCGKGILGGLERKKSTKGMGGIRKTVVYDVKYEDP